MNERDKETYKCRECGIESTPENRITFADETMCMQCLADKAKKKRRIEAIAELIDQGVIKIDTLHFS